MKNHSYQCSKGQALAVTDNIHQEACDCPRKHTWEGGTCTCTGGGGVYRSWVGLKNHSYQCSKGQALAVTDNIHQEACDCPRKHTWERRYMYMYGGGGSGTCFLLVLLHIAMPKMSGSTMKCYDSNCSTEIARSFLKGLVDFKSS